MIIRRRATAAVYLIISAVSINVSASTINGNTAFSGGGIYNNTSGTVNAASNTFDNNSASDSGGGIYNTATITLDNNTVSSNTAANGGGIYNNFTATLNNNIVALNTADDGSDLLGRGSLGLAFTGSYNLIGNADGSEGVGDGTNQAGSTALPINPRLRTLQNNGGKTFTRALMSGSPAIDKGNSPAITLDQRGQARPYDYVNIANTGNGADIGAYEVQAAPASVSVGGRVFISIFKDLGLSGATVSLTDINGVVRETLTDELGYYNFENVTTGETYVVDVVKKPYRFTPQSVTPTEGVNDLNFLGSRFVK